jgi:hypothetical protein
MSIKYLNDAWDMPGLNSAEKIVLLAIADCANNEGFAYPGYTTLTQKTGMAKTTLSKCLKVLKGAAILKIGSHADFGTGKSVNTYVISMRVLLPISSDLLLIEKINELRKESARPISSSLTRAKVASSCAISSSLLHEPSLEPPVKQSPVLKTVKFAVPELHEIEQHIADKNYAIDAESFLAFYTSNGWMVGKNKMKCWKSAMVTWAKRPQYGTAITPQFKQQSQRDDLDAEFDNINFMQGTLKEQNRMNANNNAINGEFTND